uniref:MULE transposase domain-containing protein n=1 Tax=Acrobeloides nanus TaxID=290746 RepID=A0A914E583_9BILA
MYQADFYVLKVYEQLVVYKNTKRSATGRYGKKGVYKNQMYKITKPKETIAGLRIYWKCDQKSCYAKIKTNINYEILSIDDDSAHNHMKPDPEVLKAKVAQMQMVETSAVDILLNGYHPTRCMMDFELALRNAFLAIFPNAIISFCFFHFAQSNRRHIDELGLRNEADEDPLISRQLKMLRCLAFVPEDDVITVFELLNQQLDQRLDNFVDYFERTYIGEPNRRGALRGVVRRNSLFAVNEWNVNQRTLTDSGRTNNSVEGYNHKLNNHFRVSHPPLWDFINGLKKFHESIEADLFDLNAGKDIHKPRPVWEHVEARKRHIVQRYDRAKWQQFLESMADTMLF